MFCDLRICEKICDTFQTRKIQRLSMIWKEFTVQANNGERLLYSLFFISKKLVGSEILITEKALGRWRK